MARPRVFVSSTYYDLKHLRSSLENFIEGFGFEPVLSEKGRIAYAPDIPLDESCYREVGTVDILVLIVGGRYGSEVSAGTPSLPKGFYDRYTSITREEYKAAVYRGIPTYILIERFVYAEYDTYLKNRNNTGVNYAHVDSVNIFELIEDILAQPRNNPLLQFDRYSEIESWLREQWSGLFRELLQRAQTQTQLASLQKQISNLAEINTTLKHYLEEVISTVAPDRSKRLITVEDRRLADAATRAALQSNALVRYLAEYAVPLDHIEQGARAAKSLEDFVRRLGGGPGKQAIYLDRLLGEARELNEQDLIAIQRILGVNSQAARQRRDAPAEDTERAAARRLPKARTTYRRRGAE